MVLMVWSAGGGGAAKQVCFVVVDAVEQNPRWCSSCQVEACGGGGDGVCGAVGLEVSCACSEP